MPRVESRRSWVPVRLRLAVAITMTLCLSTFLGRGRVARGQAVPPSSATDVLKVVLGPHSGEPQDAWFNRTEDTKPDRLPHEQRLAREAYLSGSDSLVLDTELLANGRPYDKISSLRDTVGTIAALPTEHAKVICVGTLTDTHGFVAEDRKSVYTEFTFTISKLYKSDNESVHSGGRITAARLGARVHFQSGHIRDYINEGKGLPKLGHEYVLFLWRPDGPSGDSYGIAAAYEIQAGHVYALGAC